MFQTERSYLVEELFKIENAVSYIANGEPALVWYPSEYVVELLELLGCEIESVKMLYDKTPWEKELLKEHLEVIEKICMKIKDEKLKKNLLHQAIEILNPVAEDKVIYAGTIYSVKARKLGFR